MCSAFNETTAVIADAIDLEIRERIVPIIRELCNPDLAQRGHPRGLGGGDQYSLIRYTSQLTTLAQRFELEQRMKRKAG